MGHVHTFPLFFHVVHVMISRCIRSFIDLSFSRLNSLLLYLKFQTLLLCSHIQQFIFTNMRVNAKPISENDVEELDMVCTMNEGPYRKARFEMGLLVI